MLLVKCSQCGASYKLSEDLYRRKAAGFGVVVTCRRCKTEIHVDADGPAPTEEEVAESDAAPTAPTHEIPTPPAAAEAKTPEPAAAQTPEPKTAEPPAAKLVTLKGSATATPLAAKPGPRLPGAPPRPAAATVKGLGVDAVKAAVAQKSTDAKATTPTAPTAKTAPKLVALSPGLLGTVTAPKPKPSPPSPPSPAGSPKPPAAAASPKPTAAASPSPPAAAPPPVAPKPAAAKPPRDPEEAAWDPSVPPPPMPESSGPESEIPVASQDFLPSDPAPSAVSVDSSELVSDPEAAAAKAKDPEPARKPLPPAPGKRGPKPEPKPEELPSTTGTPKLDTLVHGTAVPLDQKKGEPPRKRLPSGDLSDDFMSADLGFDAPALAPPSPDALTRAPVSSRPAATAAPTASKSPSKPSDAKGATPKTARPVTVKKEARAGSGRGWIALLLLAGLGAGGFAFRDRLQPKKAPMSVPAAEPPKAEAPPAVAEAEPAAPAEPAPVAEANAQGPIAAAPTAASEPAAASPPGASPAPAAPPATPAAAPRTPASPAAAPAPAPAAPAAPTAAAVRPTTTSPAPTPATPAPAPTAIEPRPPVGTEPFDAAAARAALDASAAQASSCRKPGDPSGVAVVIITFSPTGRVTTANISGPPFAATPTGGCIASTLRKTRVPAFAGDMVTVRKTVTIH
jgi:hypothetical protein